MTQLREEVFFTKGRGIVRGKTVRRGVSKKADYLQFRGAWFLAWHAIACRIPAPTEWLLYFASITAMATPGLKCRMSTPNSLTHALAVMLCLAYKIQDRLGLSRSAVARPPNSNVSNQSIAALENC